MFSRIFGITKSAPTQLSPKESAECMVCCDAVSTGYLHSGCKGEHVACVTCWQEHIISRIESFKMANMTCIACATQLNAHIVRQILCDLSSQDEMPEERSPAVLRGYFEKYDNFLLSQYLAKESDMRWCPNGCGFGVIAKGRKNCPRIECMSEQCNGKSFCYNCRQLMYTGHRCEKQPIMDPSAGQPGLANVESLFNNLRRQISREEENTRVPAVTPQFRQEYRQSIRHGSSDFSSERRDGEISSDMGDANYDSKFPSDNDEIPINEEVGEMKQCPRCKTFVMKIEDGSCNHIECSICGCEFCWLCNKEIGYSHFYMFSGCRLYSKTKFPRFARIILIIAIFLLAPPVIVLFVLFTSIMITWSIFKSGCKSVKAYADTKPIWEKILTYVWFALVGIIIYPLLLCLIMAVLLIAGFISVYIYFPYLLISDQMQANQNAKSSQDWKPPPDDVELGQIEDEIA